MCAETVECYSVEEIFQAQRDESDKQSEKGAQRETEIENSD